MSAAGTRPPRRPRLADPRAGRARPLPAREATSAGGRRAPGRASPRAGGRSTARGASRRARLLLGAGIAATLLLVTGVVAGSRFARHAEVQAEVAAGGMAPEFSAPAARGGAYRLADQRGHSLLLAFLNTRAEPGGSRADPSRAQVVFLRSMERQYRLKGLRVAIVDASALEAGKPATPDQLLNYTYDWNLSTIPVLADGDGALAGRYGVERPPATFLIRADGRIDQRWEGLLPVTELASALRALLGRPTLG